MKTALASTPTGGAANIRGIEFQLHSCLHYSLLRFLKHRELVVTLEHPKFEDAMFEYPLASGVITEHVQCKKVEEGDSANVAHGSFGGSVPVGHLEPATLCSWLAPRYLQASSPTVFFTALVLAEVGKDLRRFQPFWTRPSLITYLCGPRGPDTLDTCFPPDWLHKDDPRVLVGVPPSVRQRIRVLPMSTWENLGTQSMQLLHRYYGVRERSVASALNALVVEYLQRAGAGVGLNTVSLGRVNELIGEFQAESGSWIPAGRWLRRGDNTPADHDSGQSPGWSDFEEGRYVRRPELDEAVQSLAQSKFLLVFGHGGAGKSTLARYVTHRFLTTRLDATAYYLQVPPDSTLEMERGFFEAHLGQNCLFVIDDQQMSPEAVDHLASSFVRSWRAGETGASLLVTTTEGKLRLRSASSTSALDEPLQAANLIRFPERLDDKVLTQFLENLRDQCGLIPGLSPAQIASSAHGHVGLAVLIARASRLLQRFRTLQRLMEPDRLPRLLTSFVLDKVGYPDDHDRFTGEILPVILLQGLGITIPRGLEQGRMLLSRGGLSSEPDGDGSIAPEQQSVSALLATYLAPDWETVASACERLLAECPELLATIFRRLVQSRQRQALVSLFANNRKRIVGILRDQDRPVSLGHIAAVVRSLNEADGRGPLARGLLDDLETAHGEPSNFFAGYLNESHVLSAADVGSFLRALQESDRGRLRRLAEEGALDERSGYLAQLLESAGSCVEAAQVLRAIYDVRPHLARDLLKRLEDSHLFGGIRAQVVEDPDGMPELIRFCGLLYPVDRSGVGALAEIWFTTERLVDWYRRGPQHRVFLDALVGLARFRPRLAAQALVKIHREDAGLLEARLQGSPDVKTLTDELGRLRRIDAAIGRAAAHRQRPALAKKLSQESSHRTAGELVRLARIGGLQWATGLAGEVDRDQILGSMKQEVNHLNLIGRSLESYASLSSELAGWFEERLDLRVLMERVSKDHLLHYGYLLSGLLNATQPGLRRSRLDRHLADPQILDAFEKAWARGRDLGAAAGFLGALRRCGMTSREVLKLLRRTEEGVQADLKSQIERQPGLVAVTHALYEVQLLFPRSAPPLFFHYRRLLQGDTEGYRGGAKPFDVATTPRNMVDLGALLNLAPLIDHQAAIDFAQRLNVGHLVKQAQAEPNFGRIAVFVTGLHQTSRKMCREFIDRMIGSGSLWERFLDGDNMVNANHLARVVTKASQARGVRFVRGLMDAGFGDEIREHLEAQVNLMEVTGWLRLLSSKAHATLAPISGRLLDTVDRIAEHEGRFRILLESAEGLAEARHLPHARRLVDRAVDAADQIASITTLADLVSVLLTSLNVERLIDRAGIAAQMMEHLDSNRLTLMLLGGGSESTTEELVLAAFVGHCARHAPRAFSTAQRRAIENVCQAIAPRIVREVDPCSRLLVAVLSGDPDLADSVATANKMSVVERGLVAAVGELVDVSTKDLLRADAGEFRPAPLSLSHHARNLEFGSALRLARAAGVDNQALAGAASERGADEASAPIRWLLARDQLGPRSFRPYYVWQLLQSSVLRATFLPWQDEARRAAERLLEGRPEEYRWSIGPASV